MKNKLLSLPAVIIYVAIVIISGGLLNLFGISNWDYANYMSGASIKEAFHDQGYIYMSPAEPTSNEDVTLRVRVRKANITSSVINMTIDEGKEWHDFPMQYEKDDETGYYEYWIGIIPKQNVPYRYCFYLSNDKEKKYYNYSGLQNSHTAIGSNYYIMPDFKTPDWSKGALWYSIMPDSFYNGDTLNDKTSNGLLLDNPWGQQHYGMRDYFGGDLSGVEAKINYFKDLSVDAVFINPIWSSNHNAGYGADDFTHIDSAFGNDESLKTLSSTLHTNGMKLMLDGVFQYFQLDGVWYNKSGTYPLKGGINPTDPYYDIFFPRTTNGDPIYPNSWGNARIDYASEQLRKLIYSDKSSVMQKYLGAPYNVDGWRLDVGETLAGNTNGTFKDSFGILKDMRGYVKSQGQDKFLLSEHGEKGMLFDYSLDSKWNYSFAWPVMAWASGGNDLANFGYNRTFSQQEIMDTLAGSVLYLPRPVANASYNFLSSHDFARIGNRTKEEQSHILAAQILMMTYVGAPCIYYGDEVGMPGNPDPGQVTGGYTSFSSMNWDKTTWNTRIYNLQKALGQLRKEYKEVYKDGIFKSLLIDESNNILSFGRWNDGGKAVTVTSQNDSVVKNITINVRQMSASDGTIFTDYLTGKKYTVKDGKIIIDVLPGGTVLVSKKGGAYRAGLEILKADNDIEALTEDSFAAAGDGDILKSKDTASFAGIPSYNNAAVSAKCDNGGFAIQFKADESAGAVSYGALFEEGSIRIYARGKKETAPAILAEQKIDKGTTVKIVRQNDNTFETFISKDKKTWNAVSGSKKEIVMPYTIKAGISAIKNGAKIESVLIVKENPQLAATFDSNLSNMFTEKENATISNGKLILKPTGKKTEFLLTNAPLKDFTFKGELSYKPLQGEIAGITISQGENDYVFSGVTKTDNDYYAVVGHSVNGAQFLQGKIRLDEKVLDSIYTIQIQRLGTKITAYLVTGNNIKQIGTDLYDSSITINYSEPSTGLFVEGTTAVIADILCFGNANVDGGSINAPLNEGVLLWNYQYSNKKMDGKWRVVGNESDWNYTTGGYLYNKTSGQGHMKFVSNPLENFKSEFTMNIPASDKGYTAIGFGRQDNDSAISSAFSVRISSDSHIRLYNKDAVVADAVIQKEEIATDFSNQVRVIVKVVNEHIAIYVGQKARLVIDVDKTGYLPGYWSVFASECQLYYTSFNLFFEFRNWSVADGYLSENSDGLTIENHGTDFGLAFMMGQGVSDVAIGTEMELAVKSSGKPSKAGILLGASAGDYPREKGIFVYIDNQSTLNLDINGKNVASYSLEETLKKTSKSIYISIIYQDRKVKIFAENSISPVIEYETPYLMGGVVSLYAENSITRLRNLDIKPLVKGEDYTKLPLFQNKKRNFNFDYVQTSDFSINFNNAADKEKYDVYSGQWKIEDGVLKGKVNQEIWNCGVALCTGTISDFELTFSMKYVSGGWGASIIRKALETDTHEMTGYMFFSNNKYLAMNQSGNVQKLSVNTLFVQGGWQTIRIRAYADMIALYLKDNTGNFQIVKKVTGIGGNINEYQKGYISLNCGDSETWFDDISVRILNKNGTYVNN